MTIGQSLNGSAFEHVIPLEPPLPGILADEFAKRVYFAAEEIRGFRLIGDEQAVTAVAVTTHDAVLPHRLAAKLRFVLTNDVLPQLVRDPKVIWRSAEHREPAAGTFDHLVAQGMAQPVGEGQVVLGEPVLRLMDDLDRVLTTLVRAEFGGVEYRYPTLIPIGALDKCDYFTSFPQYAMFAVRLRSDVDNYRDFVDSMRGGADAGGEVLDRCDRVDYCLPPTMCYHTFNQYAGRQLPAGLSTVTARGKSFRHEARYHRSLTRLWDFTIREIVFLGRRDEVLAARERLLERTFELATKLAVSGRCEVAGDPFFCTADGGAQASSQRLLELKYELRLAVGPDDEIAVASFNFHERFFAERFGLSLPDGTAGFSACAGFGLERLAFALICQHGTDITAWPPAVLRVLDEGSRA